MKELLANKNVLTGAGILLAFLVGFNYWLFTNQEDLPPETYIDWALTCLGPEEEYPEEFKDELLLMSPRELRGRARAFTRRAEELSYPGQEFVVPFTYLYGTVLFREALEIQEDPDARFKKFLEAEEQLWLAYRVISAPEDNDYSEKLDYMLGVSLHEVGKVDKALKFLLSKEKGIYDKTNSLQTWEPIRLSKQEEYDNLLRLQEIWLQSKNDEQLILAGRASNRLNQELNPILTSETLRKLKDRTDPILEQKYQALLLRAQIFGNIQNRPKLRVLPEFKGITVNQILEHYIFSDRLHDDSTQIILAQQEMDSSNFAEAIPILKKIASNKGLDRTYVRKAQFLEAQCHRAIGDQFLKSGNRKEANEEYQHAITVFVRTANEYVDSDEGLASSLLAAYLYQITDQNEYAMERYQKTLLLVPDRENFRNQWFTLNEFERQIENGWRAWIEKRNFDEAITLAKKLEKLFSKHKSRTLIAETYKSHAEFLEDQLKEAPYSEWAEIETELRDKWVQAGKASELKSSSLKSAEKYSQALWESAEQYRRGHDFQNSNRILDEYINGAPAFSQARALVRLGENHMDLDQYDEAEKTFQYVLRNFPTNPGAYEAQLLLGKCYFEKSHLSDEDHDYLAMAEKAFLTLLNHDKLSPDAVEWRKALFALGELQFLRGSMLEPEKAREIVPTVQELDLIDFGESDENSPLNQAFILWQDSIYRFEELLKRFPENDNEIKSRYWLAHAYRRSAEKPQAELALAETDTAKAELGNQRDSYLHQSWKEFNALQQILVQLKNQDRLDTLGQLILKNCYLEIPHLEYTLGRYQDATQSYNQFLSEYPDDEQTLIVSMQLANCYRARNLPHEAKASVESARHKFSQFLASDENYFNRQQSILSEQEWRHWLKWALESHGLPAEELLNEI